MASLSDYSENKILNHLFRGENFTIPNLYIALFTSNAGLESNTPSVQTEVPTAGSGYARVEVPSYTGFGASTSAQTSNVVTFEFPTATLDWGTITHAALMDDSAVGSGNVILHGEISNPRTVYTGDTLRFAPNTFIVSID